MKVVIEESWSGEPYGHALLFAGSVSLITGLLMLKYFPPKYRFLSMSPFFGSVAQFLDFFQCTNLSIISLFFSVLFGFLIWSLFAKQLSKIYVYWSIMRFSDFGRNMSVFIYTCAITFITFVLPMGITKTLCYSALISIAAFSFHPCILVICLSFWIALFMRAHGYLHAPESDIPIALGFDVLFAGFFNNLFFLLMPCVWKPEKFIPQIPPACPVCHQLGTLNFEDDEPCCFEEHIAESYKAYGINSDERRKNLLKRLRTIIEARE